MATETAFQTEKQRRKLWREVIGPYRQTNIWRRMDKTEMCFCTGCLWSVDDMRTDVHHEADIIAALMRKTFNSRKNRIAVTPDRNWHVLSVLRCCAGAWGLR